VTEHTVRLSSPATLPKPMGYSHLAEITAGKLVYIAGQVPMDVNGALVGANDFRAQLLQVFSNLNTAVEAAGGKFSDIVKLNYFCVDRVPPGDQPLVREVRDRFVDVNAPPVSSFVVVSRLVRPEWLIEIEAVAVIGARA
jgi:enamine deaminase RidA (YjgF/YER057c/UK114 family)